MIHLIWGFPANTFIFLHLLIGLGNVLPIMEHTHKKSYFQGSLRHMKRKGGSEGHEDAVSKSIHTPHACILANFNKVLYHPNQSFQERFEHYVEWKIRLNPESDKKSFIKGKEKSQINLLALTF